MMDYENFKVEEFDSKHESTWHDNSDLLKTMDIKEDTIRYVLLQMGMDRKKVDSYLNKNEDEKLIHEDYKKLNYYTRIVCESLGYDITKPAPDDIFFRREKPYETVWLSGLAMIGNVFNYDYFKIIYPDIIKDKLGRPKFFKDVCQFRISDYVDGNVGDNIIKEIDLKMSNSTEYILSLNKGFIFLKDLVELKFKEEFYQGFECVYIIKNRFNQKIYVGSTNNFLRRLSQHFDFKTLKPKNYIFCEDFYDVPFAIRENVFEIKIIKTNKYTSCETVLINLFKSYGENGYNIKRSA